MSETLSTLLQEGLRAVEVGAPDLHLLRWALENGYTRYLCLATQAAMAAAARDGPVDERLMRHVSPYTGPGQLARNNGELLILSGGLSRMLATTSRYRHAAYVAWLPALEPSALAGALGLAASVLRQRLAWVGVERLALGPGVTRPIVLARLRRRTATTGRFISPITGVEAFFDAAGERGVNYTILRWFERLPEVEPGRDVDVLVADEDVATLEQLCAELPGVIRCHVHSVSGLPTTDYLGVPAFPPALAGQILARAEWRGGHYRVPSARDHFLSLAFHVVYHHGADSGVPTAYPGDWKSGTSSHDYVATLRELAAANGIEVEMTLEGLDEYLARQRWRPPYDMLVRFATRNRWLAARLAELVPREAEEHPGLAVFFLRQEAADLGLCDQIVCDLRAAGFDVLHRQVLDEQARERVRGSARGGNWSKGPWPRSGGGPAEVVVAVDPAPVVPGPATRKKYPVLSNERILVKEEIRRKLILRMPPQEQCNLIHSSDNPGEAFEYLALSLQDGARTVLARARARRARRNGTGTRPSHEQHRHERG